MWKTLGCFGCLFQALMCLLNDLLQMYFTKKQSSKSHRVQHLWLQNTFGVGYLFHGARCPYNGSHTVSTKWPNHFNGCNLSEYLRQIWRRNLNRLLLSGHYLLLLGLTLKDTEDKTKDSVCLWSKFASGILNLNIEWCLAVVGWS